MSGDRACWARQSPAATQVEAWGVLRGRSDSLRTTAFGGAACTAAGAAVREGLDLGVGAMGFIRMSCGIPPRPPEIPAPAIGSCDNPSSTPEVRGQGSGLVQNGSLWLQPHRGAGLADPDP